MPPVGGEPGMWWNSFTKGCILNSIRHSRTSEEATSRETAGDEADQRQ